MGAAEKAADADADLVAGHRRQQKVASRRTTLLGDRQRRRKHHRARVKHRAVVDIVLFGNVRGCAIDQGGEQRRGRSPGRQHLGSAVGRSHLGRQRLHRRGRGLPAPGKRRADPVDEEIDGPVEHRPGHGAAVRSAAKAASMALSSPLALASSGLIGSGAETFIKQDRGRPSTARRRRIAPDRPRTARRGESAPCPAGARRPSPGHHGRGCGHRQTAGSRRAYGSRPLLLPAGTRNIELREDRLGVLAERRDRTERGSQPVAADRLQHRERPGRGAELGQRSPRRKLQDGPTVPPCR